MSIHGDHEQTPVSGRPKYATHQDHNDRWCVEVPVDRLKGFSVDETCRQAAAWRQHVESQRDAQAPEEEYIDPIARSQNTRRRCLETAQKYTQHDRNEMHGTPENNFSNIARYWNAHLRARYAGLRRPQFELDATDVALMMAGMKAARLSYNPTHEDSWIDLAGYAACGMEIALDSEHRLP